MSKDARWENAVAALGSPWAVTQATVKNHSCCGHTFAAVDAALELRVAGVVADDVESVEVETYTTATEVAGYTDPTTDFEAKFSISYCVAAALRLGGVRLAAFTPERLTDPELRALIRATTVRAVPEFDAGFPGRRRARVTLRLRDGSTRTALRNTRKGDPDDPLTDEEMRAKFVDLAAPVLGDDVSGQLGDRLWAIRTAPDVRVALARETVAAS
jgi:2-methylcitrate dehydratase PrpD